MSRTVDCNPTLNRRTLANFPTVVCANPHAAKTLDVPYLSLEALAMDVCQSHQWQIASPLLTRRTRLAVLEELVQTGKWQALNPQSSEFDFTGTIGQLRPALNSLLRWGIDLEKLANTPNLRPELANLVQFARSYRQRLHTQKYCDRAELFWVATHLNPQPQPLLVYGYAELPRDARHFLDAIAADGSLLHLPCDDTPHHQDNRDSIAALDARGWTVKTPRQAFPQPTTTALAYANLDDEVRNVLTEVKTLIRQGVDPADIVLVTRRESTYADTVLDIAWEYDLPVRAFYALPLSATRFGTWVKAVLEAVRSRFDFEATATLLRHPLTRLGGIDWAKVRSQHPANALHWQQCGADLSPLQQWNASERSQWVQRLQTLFETWELSRSCQTQARDILAFQQFQTVLETLAQPEGDRLDFQRFSREIADSLNLLTVPAQPGRGGIALHTPLSVFGAQYSHVFVLGVAEGMFPAPPQNQPVLDFFTCKQLQRQGFPVETAVNAARRETVSFSSLFSVAATQLHLSYPQQMGKNPVLPSPYLAQFGIEATTAEPSMRAASVEESRQRTLRRENAAEGATDRVLRHAARNWAIELRRESQHPRDRFDGVTEVPFNPQTHRFSASQLTAFGQCGFKWFARYLLHVDELDEAETELSGRLRGSLYHKTLEVASKRALETGSEDLRQALLEHLDAAFAEAEELEKLPTLAAWGARRREHLARLRRTISDESFLPEGSRILAVEKSFEGEWYGLRVRGKIDRLDATPQGYVLVEYKNRSSRPSRAKNPQGKADLDVQLPLYADVAPQALLPDAEGNVRAYYYSVTKAKPLGHRDIHNPEELEAFVENLKSQLQQGAYPVEPDTQEIACEYCPHDALCRRGARLQRKAVGS